VRPLVPMEVRISLLAMSAATIDRALRDVRRHAGGATLRRAHHPDRYQFEYISQTVNAALAEGQPAISVDAKKKELVGISRTRAGHGAPRASPKRCAPTIS
jgi:hypothetical protein